MLVAGWNTILCFCWTVRGGCLGSHFVMHMTLGMQGPFTYEALSPAEIVFRPLKQTREFNAAELLQVGSLLATKYLL